MHVPKARPVTVEWVFDRRQDLRGLPEAVWGALTDESLSAPFATPARCGLVEPMTPCTGALFAELWRTDDLGFFCWSTGRSTSWAAAWLAISDERSTHGSVSLTFTPSRRRPLDDSWVRFGHRVGARFAAMHVEGGRPGSPGRRQMTARGGWNGPPRGRVLAAWHQGLDTVLAGSQYDTACRSGTAPSQNDVVLPEDFYSG